MAKVYDLDSMVQPIVFKINGEVVNVNPPSLSIVKEFSHMSKLTDEDEILNKQTELISKVLSNNTSNKTFTFQDVDRMSQQMVTAILTIITSEVQEAENNPN